MPFWSWYNVLYTSVLLFIYLFILQVKLSDYIGKKNVILFFYPLDFTFVCPTGLSLLQTIINWHFKFYWHLNILIVPPTFFFAEITAFSDRYEEFKALNTEVLGVSVDSVVRNFPASNLKIALQVVITLIFINDEWLLQLITLFLNNFWEKW